MRYKRPWCDECARLANERVAVFQEYLDAKDALTLTPRKDPAYLERRKQLDEIGRRLREAHRRDTLHENTHQDEFH